MKTFSFHTAYTQARELYGLELNPDEFESLGLIAWGKIGNKMSKLYKYQVVPDQSVNGEYTIPLPCNVDRIEAVTADYEDYQKTTPTTLAGNNQNGWIEGYIETRKFNTGTLNVSGKYIKYREEGNSIILSDKFNVVNILYKGFIVDEDGLPLLTEKEVDAVAGFCAFANMRKKALMTKDQSTFQIAMSLEQNWKLLCTQARVPDFINQNEMDEILNVSVSWDRKRFGKSFKPIH